MRDLLLWVVNDAAKWLGRCDLGSSDQDGAVPDCFAVSVVETSASSFDPDLALKR